MIRKIVYGLAGLVIVRSVEAEPLFEGSFSAEQPMAEYFTAEDHIPDRSILYLFYSDDPCEFCNETMLLTEQIWNARYADKYSLYVLNRQNTAENFLSTYQLNAPLSIVLVRVQNGESVGWQKIDNPQNLYDAPEDYTQYLTERINNFLSGF